MDKQICIKQEYKITFVAIFIISILVSSIITLSFSVFMMQFLLGFITVPLIIKKDYKTAKLYIIIFVVSIVFVFLVYMANQLYYGSPYYIGGSDDLNFEKWAFDVYYSNMYNPSKILESEIIGRYHNSPLYVVYISLLIRFSNVFDGYSTFLPRIANVYFLIWNCMIFEYFLKKYGRFSDIKTRISILVFALTPNIQYINSHIFRDTFNLTQIFFIAYLFDILLTNKKYLRKILLIGLLIFLLFIAYYTRKNSLIFAAVLCILILGEKLKVKKIYYVIIFVPLVIAREFLETIQFSRFVEVYSNYILNTTGDGLSMFIFSQPLLPAGIILRSLYAFITPFPNFFGLFKEPSRFLFDFMMLIIYFGVIVQVLAVPFIFKRVIKFDWLSNVFIVFFLGVIATTFTFRHVLFYYPFMVALGIDGYISTIKKTRTTILFFSGFIGFSLLLVYISLKFFL